MSDVARTLPLSEQAAAPAGRVVRAVLAAARLAPGDRVLLHGPLAGGWEPVLEHLGVRVERAAAVAEAEAAANRPGAAAFEAAVYVGPADDRARAPAVAAAALVRPGRNSLAAVRGENLADVPPADGLRLPDRRGPFGAAGPGGWALHTVPGAARRRENPAARTAPAAEATPLSAAA